MSLDIKRNSELGQFYLEQAVIEVLYEVYDNSGCLGASEISKKASIYRDRGKENIMNDAIVTGILIKLSDEGRVERCFQDNGKGGWKLTAKEYEKLNY